MARSTSLEDARPLAASLPVQAPHPVRGGATGLPRLSVVVVNYRQWDPTVELVRQLVAAPCVRHGDAEVVIVDNHSPPHPAVRKLRRAGGVSVRRWGSNRGFARAVNEGCRLSQGEWFLLLNPDTTLSDGFLDGVLELADRLGAAAPRRHRRLPPAQSGRQPAAFDRAVPNARVHAGPAAVAAPPSQVSDAACDRALPGAVGDGLLPAGAA